MLQKQTSSNYKKWKYLAILPLLVAFLMSFNVREVIKVRTLSQTEFIIDSKTTDPEIDAIVSYFDTRPADAHIRFSDLKRNEKGEIYQIAFETLKIKSGNDPEQFQQRNLL